MGVADAVSYDVVDVVVEDHVPSIEVETDDCASTTYGLCSAVTGVAPPRSHEGAESGFGV